MNKQSSLMIVVAAVMAVVGTFASAGEKYSAEEKYDVAAFYWPSLHFDERWAEFFADGSQGEWEKIRNCKPKWEGHWQPRVPEWGYLMDNDPKAMEKKIDAATSHGVNVMIFDWYWFENKPFLESALNDGFLKANNVDKMKFYLMWANHDAKTAWDIRRSHKMETIWPGSVDLATFKTVVARVIKKYFSHPSYYKIDGKPVFSIYDMNNLIKGLGGVKQAVEALDYFRAEVKKAGFPDLHFQMIYWGQVPKIDNSGFASAKGTAANTIKTFKVDSLTNYQFVHLSRPVADYNKWADKALSNWPKWSKDFDVPYFPHVSIGWDNNARFVAKRGAVTDNVNPETFKKCLIKAKAYADAHPDQRKLITINAWNEWVEGSYLEPDERFGMGYLDAVKDVFGPSVAKEGTPLRRPSGNAKPQPRAPIPTGKPSALKAMGGIIFKVSSFNPGHEAKHLYDGDLATFWHTRFQPDFAKRRNFEDPHFLRKSFPNCYAEIPRLDFLDVGWGSDVKKLCQSLPDTFLNIRLNPVEILDQSEGQIHDTIVKLVKDSGDPLLTSVCCVNMDDQVSSINLRNC
jgi:hypothetical protein